MSVAMAVMMKARQDPMLPTKSITRLEVSLTSTVITNSAREIENKSVVDPRLSDKSW